MKLLRAVSFAVMLLSPAVALATPPLHSCCNGGACCPGCPLCHHG